MPLHGQLVNTPVQFLHGDGLGVQDKGVHRLVERVIQTLPVQILHGLCQDLQTTNHHARTGCQSFLSSFCPISVSSQKAVPQGRRPEGPWKLFNPFPTRVTSEYWPWERASYRGGSGLPITETASANQNATNNGLYKRPLEWPPCVLYKLNRADD